MAIVRRTSPPAWTWILVGVGLIAAIGLAAHAAGAYATIDRVDQSARINTANAVLLFEDVATNAPIMPPPP